MHKPWYWHLENQFASPPSSLCAFSNASSNSFHPFNFSSINLSQNFVSKRPPKLLSCGSTQLSSLLSLGVPYLSSSLVVHDCPEFSFLGPPCATPVPYRHSCSRAASSLTSISLSVLGLHRARYLTGSLCVFSLLSTLAHLL